MLQLDNYVFKGRYEDVLGTAMIFQHDKGIIIIITIAEVLLLETAKSRRLMSIVALL
jgi:hypothetical protein